MKFLGALLAVPLALAAPAPILEAKGETIPGKWIVVMKEGSSHEAIISAQGLAPDHTYDIGDFKGFALEASDELVDTMANHPDVAYIEPDVQVSINALETQKGAPYNLARLSSRANNTTKYVYDASAGNGTFAYIIDTGIQLEHPEFQGRASFGTSFVDYENGTKIEVDDNGHGTHVAGITGARTWGVAKKTHLIAVKVLDSAGSGSLSLIVAGLQWAVKDAEDNKRMDKSVGNLSLGALTLGGSSVSDAATAAGRAGLFLAVAAGNGNLPAQYYTPADAADVCTVGAVGADDARAWFSNYGGPLKVFAPGVDVRSTYNNGSTAVLSGTSMASPHVAGLAAYLLALEGHRAPVALCERVQALATKKVVTDAESANSGLVYNGVATLQKQQQKKMTRARGASRSRNSY